MRFSSQSLMSFYAKASATSLCLLLAGGCVSDNLDNTPPANNAPGDNVNNPGDNVNDPGDIGNDPVVDPPVDDPVDTPDPGDVTDPPVDDPVVDVTPEIRTFDHGVVTSAIPSHANAGEPFLVRFNNEQLGFNVTKLVAVGQNGEILGEEEANQVEGAFVANEARYPNIFEGAHLTLRTEAHALAALLHMQALPAIAGEAGVEFLEIWEDIEVNPSSTLFYSRDGAYTELAAPANVETTGVMGFAVNAEPTFHIPRAFAKDAEGTYTELPTRIEMGPVGKLAYVTRVPTAWLKDEARAWPVMVDPPIAGGPPTPFVATVNVAPKVPCSLHAIAQFTVQDADLSSADETVTVTVDWGNGYIQSFSDGPGAFTAECLYEAGGWYYVTVTVCDGLGRCNAEAMCIAVGEDNCAPGVKHCEFTCAAEGALETRSFGQQTEDCVKCDEEIQEHCGDAGALRGICLNIQGVCGNGELDPGEDCDDGNLENGDGCNNGCQDENDLHCGNGIHEPEKGEQCDNGAANSDDTGGACRTNCVLAACGDAVVDPGEECDLGWQANRGGNGCAPDCTIAACGDGIQQFPEECDDGNTDAGDGCDADCLLEAPNCGDGVVQDDEGEECDDGNTDSGDGCDYRCRSEAPFCGDGELACCQLEECDDGNNVAGDGCSPTCEIEHLPDGCGNGMVEPGEECDDGNNTSGDGCDWCCKLEP